MCDATGLSRCRSRFVPAVMMLSVRLLMHIYNGVLLSCRLKADFWLSTFLTVTAPGGPSRQSQEGNRIYSLSGLSTKVQASP